MMRSRDGLLRSHRWRRIDGVLNGLLVGVLLFGLVPASALPVLAGSEAPEAFTMPADDALAAAAAGVVDDEPPEAEELPTLEQVRDAWAAYAEALPESEWDIAALAEALDFDPERAFDLVRDRIAFDPYAGVLRGAAGTLAARAGNAADRALLLGAILDAMAVPYRFAVAELDDATAARLIDRAAVTPAVPLPAPGLDTVATFDPSAIASRARRDYARLREALGHRVDAMDGSDAAAALEAVRHHVWVQAAYGSEWRDLDPTLPDAIAGSSLASPAETVDGLPDEDHQAVTMRVIAESLDGGTFSEAVALDRTFRASEAAAQRIFLYFQPAVEGVGGAVVQALSGDISWLPVLLVDDEAEAGQSFRTGGRGTDVFGEQTAAPELVSLRLEVEVTGPTHQPVKATRILLDRLPSDLRDAGAPVTPEQLMPMAEDDAGPYAMAQIHHVMVSTGGTDRRDHALQRSWSADWVGRTLDGADPTQYSLSDLLWPVAEADQALVVASEAAVVPSLAVDGSVRSYVSSPRVYLLTLGRDALDGSIAFATDLLIDGATLLPRDPAFTGAARLRLWYGALQTALETEIALGRAAVLDPAKRSISGVSLAGGGSLTVLTSGDAAPLPTDISPALRRDLAGGSLVLVPAGEERPSAWWSVDPQTGAARSVLDPGLGGVVPSGPLAESARIVDSSYTHGAGGRLPPRPPMVRPPGGGGYTPATCASGSEETTLFGCITIPASVAYTILGGIIAIEIYYIIAMLV